jgi:hypothetical protein
MIEHLTDYNIYPEILTYNYYKEKPPEDLLEYEIVFIRSDFGFPIKRKIIQFLCGAEKIFPHTYSWFPIDLSYIKPFKPSEDEEVPTIGFVGRAPVIHGLENDEPTVEACTGFSERLYAIQNLGKSDIVCTDFHVRTDAYAGDACGYYEGLNDATKRKNNTLFPRNMEINQYNLCARGNGNYSHRFYETLAYGRIPVYIESRGRIAFDHFIGETLLEDPPFVWVDNPKYADISVLEFHETHDIKECQKKCRKLYEDYFTIPSQVKLFKKYIKYCKPFTWRW